MLCFIFAVFQAAFRQGRGQRKRAQNLESGQRREGGQRRPQGSEEQDQQDGDVGRRERRGAEQDAVRQHRNVPLVPLQGARILPHGQTGGRDDRLAGRTRVSIPFARGTNLLCASQLFIYEHEYVFC